MTNFTLFRLNESSDSTLHKMEKKRRVEYVRPFGIKTTNVQVNFKVIYVEHKSELKLERTDIHSSATW